MTRRRKTTLSHRPDGWTSPAPHLEPKRCATVLPRSLAGLPPCTRLTVWRVERYGSGYVQSGYYCAEHLPADVGGAA